jgi:hypothetical protein
MSDECKHETYWRPLEGQGGWERFIHGFKARILPAQVNREIVYDLSLRGQSNLVQFDWRELSSLDVAKAKAVAIVKALRWHITVPRKRKPPAR